MWIAVALVVGLVAIGGVVLAVLIGRRREAEAGSLGSEMSADQWISLGVIFTGAGTALTITMGPFMIWMIGLGIIYLGMGARMKRDHPQ